MSTRTVESAAHLLCDGLLDKGALLFLALEDGGVVTWLVLNAMQGGLAALGRDVQGAG